MEREVVVDGGPRHVGVLRPAHDAHAVVGPLRLEHQQAVRDLGVLLVVRLNEREKNW